MKRKNIFEMMYARFERFSGQIRNIMPEIEGFGNKTEFVDTSPAYLGQSHGNMGSFSRIPKIVVVINPHSTFLTQKIVNSLVETFLKIVARSKRSGDRATEINPPK